MGLLADAKILYHLALKPVRGRTHRERMESFYAGQAEAYDSFRRRLLQGREALWGAIEVPEGGVWVDLGGGTGANIEFLGPRIERLAKIYVVDLSASLLEVASRRIAERGFTNAEAIEADATTFRPPDWFAAVDNAQAMLRAGGRIGVVDFYVSRKHPAEGFRRHGRLTRHFWPAWFSSDNVFLSADHVPHLHHHFEPEQFGEHRAKVPYMPLVRVPYYMFVGRKR
jgi:S-adenosylmethionine-diacylgycerolhomoserine-N-methlytransferase